MYYRDEGNDDDSRHFPASTKQQNIPLRRETDVKNNDEVYLHKTEHFRQDDVP